MANGVRINWGIKELERQLANIDKYDHDTQKKMREAVRTSTTNIMIGAKRRVPVRSGNLIKGITMTYDAVKNTGIVKVKSPHAHLVEFGHKGGPEVPDRKKALHGGELAGYASKVIIPDVPEHPYLRPAFQDEKPHLIKSVGDATKS
jgi:HK97 gp10 family phage protein